MRSHGLLALNFLICARPASVRELLATDVRIKEDVIEVQLRRFKYAETGVVPRIALRIPLTGPYDEIGQLFSRLVTSAPPSGFIFPDCTRRKSAPASFLGRAMSALIAETGTIAPLGFKFTPRSLRSGGMSAAYATGLPLELVMRLSNHTDEQVVRRHYLDPQTVATTHSALFFSRFKPPHLIHGTEAGRT